MACPKSQYLHTIASDRRILKHHQLAHSDLLPHSIHHSTSRSCLTSSLRATTIGPISLIPSSRSLRNDRQFPQLSGSSRPNCQRHPVSPLSTSQAPWTPLTYSPQRHREKQCPDPPTPPAQTATTQTTTAIVPPQARPLHQFQMNVRSATRNSPTLQAGVASAMPVVPCVKIANARNAHPLNR